MQKTLKKKAQIYTLKVIKRGTVWFHVGKENSCTDYLKINSITESFEIGKEYDVLALKEEVYNARWGRKTYYYPVTEEEATKIEVDVDVQNARKKLNKCKEKNSLSSSLKNSIIKLAHSNEVILKELNDFEESLKDNTSILENNLTSSDKKYFIENIPYIRDKDGDKCMVGDDVVVFMKNKDVIEGKIDVFEDNSFILKTVYMPITIQVKDIILIKKR